MAHCRAPSRCSVCLQAAGQLAVPVRRVDLVAGEVTVDGKPVVREELTPWGHKRVVQ